MVGIEEIPKSQSYLQKIQLDNDGCQVLHNETRLIRHLLSYNYRQNDNGLITIMDPVPLVFLVASQSTRNQHLVLQVDNAHL